MCGVVTLQTVIKFSELRLSLYDDSKEVENGEDFAGVQFV